MGYNDKRVYGVSLSECKDECSTASFACKSFDYQESSKKCWLSKDSKETKPSSYQEPCTGGYSDLIYLEITEG